MLLFFFGIAFAVLLVCFCYALGMLLLCICYDFAMILLGFSDLLLVLFFWFLALFLLSFYGFLTNFFFVSCCVPVVLLQISFACLFISFAFPKDFLRFSYGWLVLVLMISYAFSYWVRPLFRLTSYCLSFDIPCFWCSFPIHFLLISYASRVAYLHALWPTYMHALWK